MAETVRIDPASHAALAEIARAKRVPLSEALARAVEALRREVFFEALNAGYAELRADPRAWADEETERAIWDRAIADGLEGEPPYNRPAAGRRTKKPSARVKGKH